MLLWFVMLAWRAESRSRRFCTHLAWGIWRAVEKFIPVAGFHGGLCLVRLGAKTCLGE